MAVRRHSVFCLLQPDDVAQIEIDATLCIAHRVAKLLEFRLQSDALIARELRVLRWPDAAERPAAARPVGQMADGERENVGIVIALDHVEVLAGQKCGSGCAARKEQDGISTGGK